MTLTLILTRHAKSSWRNDTLADHDRPLNKRGVRNARSIGGWLKDKGVLPGECLCSTAVRAQATCALIQRALPEMKASAVPSLYHASALDILNILRGATAPVVLMIGHNPGIQYTAHGLVVSWPRHPGFEDYPTGATTIIRFKANRWQDVDWKCGTAVGFVVPRELTNNPARR